MLQNIKYLIPESYPIKQIEKTFPSSNELTIIYVKQL